MVVLVVYVKETIALGMRFRRGNDRSSSLSYSVYPTYRKLRSGFEEGKTATTHTHKGERGQRSPPTRER